jgi:hypothetical protein
MTPGRAQVTPTWIVVPLAVVLLVAPPLPVGGPVAVVGPTPSAAVTNDTAVGNFSAAIGRLVTLVGAAGGGLLALVWTRVALSWFSNDLGKKVQAKDRARDALVGTLLFVAALSGLLWALARWVVGGG